MKRLAILLGLAVVALGVLGGSSAANRPLAGDLDPSFGHGGVITQGFGHGEYASIGGVAVQSDGRIVVVGGSGPGDHGLIVMRYLPDGSPDASFGKDGIVETPFKGGFAFSEAVALEPSGKIVVAGIKYGDSEYILSEILLARYNADGSLDTGFGHDGLTTTAIDEGQYYSSAGATQIAILPSGKILAAGSGDVSDGAEYTWSSFLLARYSANGILDPTFGTNGITETSWEGSVGGTNLGYDRLWGMAVEPSGKIVAAGTADSMGPEEREGIMVARYRADGSPDPTFGKQGKVLTGGHARLLHGDGVAIQRDGSIVVPGQDNGNGTLLAVRYTPNGSLDPSFGHKGVARLPKVKLLAYGAIIQPDGKILIAGGDGGRFDHGVVLVRLRPDGALDRSFGVGGVVPKPVLGDEAPDPIRAIHLQPDGAILAGGQSHSMFALAKYVGGDNCAVPNVRGKRLTRAKLQIRHSACKSGRVSKRFSGTVSKGRVIWQRPRPGKRLAGGSKVNLVVSKGKRR